MKKNKVQTGSKEFVFLMAFMMAIGALTIDTILPAFDLIANDLPLAYPNQIQLVLVFIFAGLAIGQLFSGPLSDSFGRMKILTSGIIVYLFGSLLCFFSTNIEMLLIGRFIQGIGVSGPYIATISIIRDNYSGRSMAKIMSMVMMIFIMVPTIAPALGQLILYVVNWRAIFLLYVIYSLVILCWASIRLEETLVKEKRIAFKFSNIVNGFKTIMTNRVTVTYMIANGLMSGVMVGELTTVSMIFKGKYNVGDMFAFYFAIQAMAFGVSSLINSRVVEKFGMRYICIRSTLLITGVSFSLVVYSFFAEITFPLYFLFGMALLFSVGMIFGNLNALAMEPMGKIAGLASAIIGSSSHIIGAILGTIIGLSYNGSVVPVLIGFMLLGISAFFIILFEKSQSQK